MIGHIQNLDVQIPKDIIQYWGWFLAFGIALVVLGVLAIGRAVTATIVSILFFGWLLLLACGIEVAQAIVVGHWAGFFHHLVAAILFGVTGFLIVTRPLLGAEVATMLMAVFFLIGGLFQVISSAWVALPGWGWQLVDGIITFILGVLVLAQWPVSGLWVIGLFIGIDLIFYGGAWIALAVGLRASS
ncbi:MAG: HdeD family acid-resistance protein [Xanthobacteraceae bacterium]